jgi:SAM-dependent methyltransferase
MIGSSVSTENDAVLSKRRTLARAATLALLIGFTSLADAKTRADCEAQYTPQRGQQGKDVIWVPTGDTMVASMLELAKVTPADKVYDLGAGDGKIAIAANKRFGATAIGVEYDADLAAHAQCLVEAEGVQEHVKVVQGDIFATDFSAATVVTLYLLPALNLRLRPILLDMKPGTRVVSYSFTMADWDPDDHVDNEDGSAYLWIVPADVQGTWTFHPASGDEGFDVMLDQTFQNLEGSAGGAAVTGKLSGEKIDFAFTQGGEPTRVTGTVDGDRFSGTVMRGGKSTEHSGTRK